MDVISKAGRQIACRFSLGTAMLDCLRISLLMAWTGVARVDET
jgi:hypothetical protein